MPPQIGKHGVVEIKDYDYGDFKDRNLEDFDFPVSETFAGYYQEQFGHLTSHFVTSTSLDRQQSSQETLDPLTECELRSINKELVALARQAKLQSQENRRDLQEHFKHHSYTDKKRNLHRNII